MTTDRGNHQARWYPCLITVVFLFVSIGVWVAAGRAESPRVLDSGKRPDDIRLQTLKDLNGYFPFFVPATPEAWQDRAEYVRRRILVAEGLWPMPTKTRLNPTIHGRIEQSGYTVEKVFFESAPGFYVTGNLYRPRGKSGKHPGILCPHGHWADARFYDCGPKNIRKQLGEGAERFEDAGRNPIQSRCVQLARMGCIVFHWDMIGYADSQQIPTSIAHHFDKQRPDMNRNKGWGLFSPQAESHLQSVMGLQTLNAIRSLDFLLSLPDVDASRIGITGASGGGTQTFILSAIDPRITVSFPAVMVSTGMQGGCTCENACCLRIGTGNVEFAALFAPKPLGMTAANDWTHEMETKGFPQLKQLFKILGHEKQVMLKPLLHFGHNYNYVSRAAMYSWFNKHFRLGLSEPIVEEDSVRLTGKELTVWDAKHPQPQGGVEFERKLLQWWTDDSSARMTALLPTDAGSLAQYRKVVGGALDVIIGRSLPDMASLDLKVVGKKKFDGYLQVTALLTHQISGPDLITVSNDGLDAKAQEQLPLVLLLPKKPKSRVVIWISKHGKAGLFDKEGAPAKPIQRLLDEGIIVCGADLFMQGEFLADGKPVTQTRRVANKREAAAYTFGYNPSLFVRRVHDILTVVAMVRGHEHQPKQVDLVGLDGAGPWVAAARARASKAITRAAIDTGRFRFADVHDLHDPQFLPGGAKYDDLPGMLAVAAPQSTWLAGEDRTVPSPIAQAYAATGHPDRIQTYQGNHVTQAAVNWLLDGRTSPLLRKDE